MPDIKDAKRQLHDALTEAGAMPQWELVATRQFLDQPDTMRLRVDGGHLYIHGNAMTFVPYVAGDAAREQLHRLEEENGRLHGQLEQEQRGREQAEARCEELRRSYARSGETIGQANDEIARLKKEYYRVNLAFSAVIQQRNQAEIELAALKKQNAELRAERDATRAEMERRDAEWQRGNDALGHKNAVLSRKNAELRRQVDDWEAEAHKYHQQARDLEAALSAARAELDEARRETLDLREAARTSSVGPDGMRQGPLEDTSCTGRAPAEVGPSSFTMRGCRLTEGHAGPCDAWQQCEMGTADKRMRCRLTMGHTGECALGRA